MESFSNAAIALAYFLIPLALLPLLQETKREIWINLLLAVAFVFSCAVGHTLEAFDIHFGLWHWVTAIVSWSAAIVLLRSRAQLRYLSETVQLLEATWEQSIVGKMLFERAGDDLRLVKTNLAAQNMIKHLLQPGDRLCEKMPAHRQKVYPYEVPLIDLYLQVLNSGNSQRLEFRYEGEAAGWYLNLSTALSKDLLFITFLEISGTIHDPLTGIYNRRILESHIEQWHTCLYIDLDRFKLVNDQRGHHIGDAILIAVAQSLRKQVRQFNGIAVRDGGDEFLLLIPAKPDHNPEQIAATILQEIQAIDVEGANVSASIGVANGKIDGFEDCEPGDRLKLAAETAVREAKRDRRSDLPQNRIRFWNSELARRRLRQITIETYLNQQDSEQEFWLAYQPICCMKTGEIVGAEALVRWNSAKLGAVSPSEFVPVAEATGLIYPISDWVLRHALQQLKTWHQISPRFSISVNISPLELEEDDFPDRIHQHIAASGVPSQFVGLEVTERGIYRDLDHYLESLQALQDMSIRLKVDDFGTGQSGLAQLLQFRFDEVKVDRCFVPTHSDNTDKIAICEAIATLSQGIQFGLIAEGIEKAYQRELMLSLNYHYGQGYLFAKPMTAEDLTSLLTEKAKLL
ncbi:MAG: hypothetical protein Kow00121_40420 [Elainellaceae cyanobacterium]